MALLGQFRQAENITGSFDETAGYRSCRSPLELCSMWSLRVTNFAQHARRRSGWRVARGVDQKCQKTENNVYRWQCIILGFTAMHYAVKSWNELLSANTNKLKSSNSLCHRAKPKHLEADSETGSWTSRVTTEEPVGRLDADTWWLETLFLRYSSVTKRLIYAYCSPCSACARAQEWQCDALWYSDTETVSQDELEQKLTSVWASIKI